MARISCLAVCTTLNSTYIESHTFHNLLVDSTLIAYRPHHTDQNAFKSMLVGTLLAILRQSLFIGKRVPLTLANILSGANHDPEESIMVTTSQIPVFTQDFMSPHYSYRTFGPLGRLAINFNVPLPMFDFNHEVYTPLNIDHPHSVTFANSWKVSGIQLDSHFILIFFDASSAVFSPRTRFISNQPSTSSHPSMTHLDHQWNCIDVYSHATSSSDSHSNSPAPILPLGANYTNYFHSNIPSRNSPVSSDFQSPAPAFPLNVGHHPSYTSPHDLYRNLAGVEPVSNISVPDIAAGTK